MLVGTVLDTFEIKGRGLVVAMEYRDDKPAKDISLNIGDEVEMVHNGIVTVRAMIAGIDMVLPPPPPTRLGFLLRAVSKADVPIGAEVRAVRTTPK